MAAVEELREGTFNAAYAVRLVDGRSVILKVAPPGAPLLTYERGLLHTEALCLRTFAERTEVPHPRLLATGLGRTGIGREYLVTSALAGASWSSQAGRITPAQRRVLRRRLGRHVAALHTVTGPGPFGYPAPGSTLVAPTWPAAYQRIVEALVADADRYSVALPQPTSQVQSTLSVAAEDRLGAVTIPVLVHADLWAGNIFVDLTGAGPVVTGFIDQERALWADPALDLASLALFGDVTEDEDFVAGYREGGGPVVFDAATTARLPLYRALLALIMLVETGPRGTTGPGHERHHTVVDRWLSEQLTTLERP